MTWRTVPAPADRVWPLLADTGWWPRWGPSVRAVEPDGVVIEPGLVGRVQTAVGPWMGFEIGEVVPGRRWDWSVAGIAATSHVVDPVDEFTCRVGFGVPTAAAPYLAVCRLALRRIAALADDPAISGREWP
ncbi:MAG: SRPBCC family protein [Actinomycetota bacterium]